MVSTSATNSISARDPTASILMAVHNESPDLLDTACRSILSQTMADFELILIDDGSQRDDTLQTLHRLAAADRRIRLFHEPHRGLTRTLNIGLSHCRAEFVCRQDSDDWSEPDRLACQIAFLLCRPELSVVGSWAMFHQAGGKPLWVSRLPIEPAEVTAALHHMNPFIHGAICFRREMALSIGGYREQFTTSQDYDFLWRLCDAFGGANLPQVLYHHRFTGASISATRARDQATNRLLARRLASLRSQGLPEHVEEVRAEIDPKVDSITALLKQADHHLLAGEYARAFTAQFHAMGRAPFRQSVYLKTVRALLFILAPALRPRLFGHKAG